MKTQISDRKFLKHGMLILALFLAMGLFASLAAQPTYAATTSYVTATTLATPTITAGGSKGYDSTKIYWSAVSGATFYEIYYASSATGTYYKAGTATASATSFVKTGLTTGKTYYFKVRAGAVSGTTKIYSKFSAYKALKPIPAQPVAKAASASYTSIKISWNAVPGATGYKVYRGTSATGTFAYRGATANLSYTNSNLVTGKYYYYKVIAYRTVNGVQVNSKVTLVYAKPVPSAPTCSVSTKTATKANISWTGVYGATKYQVWRSTSATGTYALVYTASSTARSYVNTGLTNGTTYYYKVRAYHLEGTTNVYGTSSSVKSVKLGSVYGTGMYKVGTDIPAGEYLLVATDVNNAFYFSSSQASDNEYYWNGAGIPAPTLYATLTTGEYASFEYLKAYPIASAPKVGVNADGTFVPGQYKVGRDIPAGTYVIDLQGTTNYGDLYVEMNSYNQPESVVGWDSYRGRIYVTLALGQYFTFDMGTAYPLAIAPPLDKSQPNLHDGMYLVGTDIPAGTYTIVSKDTEEGYYGIYSDATHSNESVIDFDLLDTPNKQVTVYAGEYLYVFEGYFAQLSDI
jgi:fibronectin type 3 domain-containing protein